MIEIRNDYLFELSWSKVTKFNDFINIKPKGKGVYLWIMELNNDYYPYYVGTSCAEGEYSIHKRQLRHFNNLMKNKGNLFNMSNLISDRKDLYECINEYSIDYNKRNKLSLKQETKYFICNDAYKNELKNYDIKNRIVEIANHNIENTFITYVDCSDPRFNYKKYESLDIIQKNREINYLTELLEGIIIKYIKNKFKLEFYSSSNSILGKIQRAEFKKPTGFLIENIVSEKDNKYFSKFGNEFVLFKDDIDY